MPTEIEKSEQGLPAGTLWGFLAELLMLPTAVLTAAFLSRRLDADSYGVYALVIMLVNWAQWMVAVCFSRATVKLVSGATSFEPVAATMVRFHFLVSLVATLALWLSAPWLAGLLHEPELAFYLRLAVIGMPLFSLAQAHGHCLVGLGRYREQAVARGSRWIARMLLIVLLVELGLSLSGVMLGVAGAALVECLIVRRFIRLPWRHPQAVPLAQVWGYAGSLGLVAMSLRLHERIDLFALQALGGNLAEAGLYSAAQNLTMPWSLLAFAFTPILLRSLSRSLRDEDLDGARTLAGNALRAIILLIPVAALIAGAAPEIATFVYGPGFTAAGLPLAWLIFAATATMTITVCVTILTAADRLALVSGLTLPLLPLAIVGHLIFIPWLGIQGAALVTTMTSGLGALVCVAGVYRHGQVQLPLATLGRSVLVAGLAYGLASGWPVVGAWLLLKLTGGVLLIGLAYGLLGERILNDLRRLLGRPLVSPAAPSWREAA